MEPAAIFIAVGFLPVAAWGVTTFVTALADVVVGGALPPLSRVARAPPPRARPPRRRLLEGTAMGHEDGPSLAPGSQRIAGAEAHAAPDALDTIIMFLARRVNLTVRPTSTPQR